MSLEKDYDIILMDVNMPRLDGLQATMEYQYLGFQFTVRIRQREENTSTPRCFICGEYPARLNLMASNDCKWFLLCLRVITV
jgi:CheY-like chemotaxis protein